MHTCMWCAIVVDLLFGLRSVVDKCVAIYRRTNTTNSNEERNKQKINTQKH